jgi:uncharacterized protein involved in exopolysaccharide biosynthesis/Mrp family chromosome partitioning ATPase
MQTIQSHFPEPATDGAIFDVWIVLNVLRRRWRILAGAMAAGALLGLVYTGLKTPKYTATSTVMLNQRTEAVIKDSPDVLSPLPKDPTVADTQVEYLRAPSIAKLVVAQLHLDKDPRVAVWERGLIGRFLMRLSGNKDPNLGVAPADLAVWNLTGNVAVLRRGYTQVIDISYKSAYPELAAKIANGYAEAYLEAQVSDKVNATQVANRWLTDRTEQLRTELVAAEKAVADYQAGHGLLVATGSALNEQQVTQLQVADSAARADLAEKRALLDAAKSELAAGRTGEDLGAALNSPVIAKLREQLTAAKQRLADLETRYGDRHPDVLNARAQEEQVNVQIRAELQRIIGGLSSDVIAAQSRVAALEGSLGGAKGTLAQGKSAQVGLDELTRNAEAKRTLYESYLSRLQQTSTNAGLATPDATVVSLADVPTKPSEPKLALDLALGLIGGASLGGAIAALLELLSTGMLSRQQVERSLDVSVLASVPLVQQHGAAPADLILKKPLSLFSEAFRQLRVYLEAGLPSRGCRVIAVVSALPKEGKTMSALAFGRSLAQTGARVLLIDCDTRMRALSKTLDVGGDAPDVQQAISAGRVDLKALPQDPLSACQVLPASDGVVTSEKMLDAGALRSLLDQLRGSYDFILLDAPPVIAVADSVALSTVADGVLFLVRWRVTPRKAAQEGIENLRAAGAVVLGAVLTQVDIAAQPLNSGGLAYHRQYAQYYND